MREVWVYKKIISLKNLKKRDNNNEKSNITKFNIFKFNIMC